MDMFVVQLKLHTQIHALHAESHAAKKPRAATATPPPPAILSIVSYLFVVS